MTWLKECDSAQRITLQLKFSHKKYLYYRPLLRWGVIEGLTFFRPILLVWHHVLLEVTFLEKEKSFFFSNFEEKKRVESAAVWLDIL